MATEKTFDRADLLRFFLETDRDALVGRLVVIHPLSPSQLTFGEDAAGQGETRRYPVIAETIALYCERYGFSILVQQVLWPDSGDQYLPQGHPLRNLTRDRRVQTRYGGTAAQLARWAIDSADEFRAEVAAAIPTAAIDLTRPQTVTLDDFLQSPHIAGPLTEIDMPAPQAEEGAAKDPAPDPDHNATGETMDDFLSGLDSDTEE